MSRGLAEHDWVEARVVDVDEDARTLTVVLLESGESGLYKVDDESMFLRPVGRIERDPLTGVTIDNELLFEDVFEGSEILLVESMIEPIANARVANARSASR